MNKDYFTVKELSEKVGISTQAIYKKLQTDLHPYLQIVKGKKCLNIKVLELFEQQENTNNLTLLLQPVVNLLQQQMSLLQEELEIKNKQIEELNLRLAEAHQMTEQLHYLHGAEKIEKISDKSSVEPKDEKNFLSRFLGK